ncbi:MAG TPA: fibronectin type III domain-containing protein, partial [Acidimicrobiales bacterium]|nr:fibronectin type III domain-containing protein [Acidimicrobiales bacterium]
MTTRPARSVPLAIVMVAVLGVAILPGTALADDGNPPTLDALAFTPATLVNGADPVTLTVAATFTDQTGVVDLVRDPDTGEVLQEGPTISFSAPRGSASVVGYFERNTDTAGNPDDFRANVTFPPYAAVGEWAAVVGAADPDYNWLYLDSDALVGLGFPGAVTVTGTDDVTPPALVSISSATYQSVDVGDCSYLNRRVQFDAVITDDLSGFYPGSPITFMSPSGNTWQTGFDPQGADNYLVELYLDMDTELGTWTAYDAVLADVVGNESYQSATDLSVSFEVTRTFHGGRPGAPTDVTVTIAADGEGTVSWVAPADDGGVAITGYGITVGHGEQGATLGEVDGTQTTASIGVLDPGVTYTVTVSANNACGSAQSDPVTVAAIPESGGTVSTTPGAGSVTTDVIVPAGAGGGSVTIAETALGTAPSGYEFVGQQFEIESTAATTVDNPLTLVFHVDPSLVPFTIFRNGVPITSPCSPVGTATPSPCVASGAGTSDMTILTASASTWNVGQRLGYDFNGFLGAVSNPPTINQVKAG